jgi:murein DD-endopeptidase MepM/ murein hydrolase activator NlpD
MSGPPHPQCFNRWTGLEFLMQNDSMSADPSVHAVSHWLTHCMKRRELLRSLGCTAAAATIFQNVGPAEQDWVSSVLSKPSSWVWPLSGTPVPNTIGSPFGPRLNFGKFNFHEGIDLRAPEGTAVYAAAAGKIHRLTDDAGCVINRANNSAERGCEPRFPGGGRIVAIDHGYDLYTAYFHLARQADGLQARTPTKVRAGQVIGFVGQTGKAESGQQRDGARTQGALFKSPLKCENELLRE